MDSNFITAQIVGENNFQIKMDLEDFAESAVDRGYLNEDLYRKDLSVSKYKLELAMSKLDAVSVDKMINEIFLNLFALPL